MKKVVIYGVGKNCGRFMKFARKIDYEIVAFADKNKAGQYFGEHKIIKPEALRNLAYDEIFLMVNDNRAEIAKELHSMFGTDQIIRDVNDLNETYMLTEFENYSYIFISDDLDYLNLPYKDILERKDVLYSSFLLTNKKMKTCALKNEEKTILIFRSHCLEELRESGIVEYLKACYPSAKMVFLLSDMCDGEFGYLKRLRLFSLEYIRKMFDVIVTYHSQEAEKYGFLYYEFPYSESLWQGEKKCQLQYDLFFVGNAKNRLHELHKLVRLAREHQITYRFWINNVKHDEMINDENIVYNQYLSYPEYLEKLMGCRCIVDICQKNDETTLRYSEAIIYNKKLLTTDSRCWKKSCYDARFIKYFQSVDEIDFDWIKNKERPNYNYEKQFDPNKFLDFLSRQL